MECFDELPPIFCNVFRFQRALAMPWPELKEELKEEEKLDPERRSELADEIAADIGFVT